MRTFNSILVANRGEIAVRVMRSAQSLGYRAIAVYSEADAEAPHVKMADDAILIGAAPVGESYLDMSKIITAAKKTGAEAIHPGYGFLSENAEFARKCEQENIVFIGPSADSIDLMGNKAAAKRRMIEAQVPCVPGYEGDDQSDEAMLREGNAIGFPLMVKAAAGGGGRGMRLVEAAENLADALATARSEARNAFGSGELILEKAIIQPRHVEVQVFADSHGNTIHLGERDCSVQRRHQKVVEEAPCPVMTEELRARMGAAAVEAAQSISYKGAGTVEFLLDSAGEFYFLEMNTRLQVEHPVTELITGLDLVALQIKVADGQQLGLVQDDITLSGHAIEVRLYAEDPAQDFLPMTGRIELWQPAGGEGIRVDAGIETGGEISPFYDPMIAKVIAWGESREIARNRLINALKDTAVFGSTTNRSFLIDVLGRAAFAKGKATTAFIGDEFTDKDLQNSMPTSQQAAIAATTQLLVERNRAFEASLIVSPQLKDWSSAGQLATRYVYPFGDDELDLTVLSCRNNRYDVLCGDDKVSIEIIEMTDSTVRLNVDGRRDHILYSAPHEGMLDLSINGESFHFRNRIAFAASAEEVAGGGRVAAPMHGALLEVFVKAGDQVTVGTRLAVLEAMKMQHDILAEIDGTVQDVFAKVGNQVAADDHLMEIAEPE